MALIVWSPERAITIVDVHRPRAEASAVGGQARESEIVLERREA